MAQFIDIEFRERATSTSLNKRFRDITGPAVLAGFRLGIGSEDFSISLLKAPYISSVAITPSGARIEEDQDIPDAVMVQPNDLNAGSPRVDSIYLYYQFGTTGIPASYVVVPGVGGSNQPASNPNPQTYLLLGYVNVPPLGAAPRLTDLTSVQLGINSLEVANSSMFHGPATFEDTVVFNKPVIFNDGTTGVMDPNSSFFDQLPYPIIANPGQQTFTLPSSYSPNTATLEVFKDWVAQPPNEFLEDSATTFKFLDHLNGGEKIWARWSRNVALYTPAAHDHDDLYYRKNEINNRSLHYTEDYFAGMDGRIIYHYLGTTDYVVTSIVPTDKSSDVGDITIEKQADQIIVYNTGTYRGKFDISFYMKQSYQYTPNDEDLGFFNITSSNLDAVTMTWKHVDYKRSDGTVYITTDLDNFDARGYYRRLTITWYNSAGTDIIETKVYALDYNVNGLLYQRTLLPS
jgi:hypothetical protein